MTTRARPSTRSSSAGIRRLAWLLPLAPALAAVLVVREAPAGPPGPWVFIPPPLPGSAKKPAPAPPPSAAPTSAVSGPEGMERARVSTVVIERNKKPIGLGVLLSEKSVVITALSPITVGGGTDGLEVRFPESNSSTKVKLHHQDDGWDLALLVPQASKWSEGARASDADPLSPTGAFSTFVLLKNGKVQPQVTAVLGRRDYLSPDGDVLKDALSLDAKNVAIGTPLVDGGGGVVGVIGRACAPGTAKTPSGGKAACSPALFGVPLTTIRKFLKSAPVIKAPTPWLGIVGVTDKLGVRVLQVQEGSPAQTVGLRGGEASAADSILAVDGALVKTSEELGEQIKKRAPGDELKLLVTRQGAVREVKVILRNIDDPETAKPVAPPTAVLPLPPLPPGFGLPTKAKLAETY